MIMEKFKEIADYITEAGLDYTSNGSYIAYFNELEELFDVSVEWIKEHAEDISDAFDYEIVAECIIEDDCFDMMFYMQYCCEHCDTYKDGKRCYKECCSCECWCDGFNVSEEDLVRKIARLQEERTRFLTIAYNAICFGQLDEMYDKERLLEELGCSEEEYDEIMKD